MIEKHSTKNHKKEPFILYPNPATDKLIIEFTNVLDKNATFVLYDLSGREMIRYNLEETNNKFNINISTLQSGIYIYNVSSNEVTTGKIVINN